MRTTGSVNSYAWLQHYGLTIDGSADFTDPDADGHATWHEWRCQTDPTNALSVLRLLSATRAGANVTVSWQSVAGVNYFLERSTNLSASPPFTLLPRISRARPTRRFSRTRMPHPWLRCSTAWVRGIKGSFHRRQRS